MRKRALTDRLIKSLKPAPAGKRVIHYDSIVPNFGVRVTDTGAKSFVLVTRFPGHPQPTPRALGAVGELTLQAAQDKARSWLEMIHMGRDPAREANKAGKATFGAAAEAFIAEKLPTERQGRAIARMIR